MDKNDFANYLPHWKSSPNPSNQNFHNKMIRSLAINNHVDVISIRPFSKSLLDIRNLKKEEKEDGNIVWHYIAIQRDIFRKLINGHRQVNSLVKKYAKEDSIVFVDTINPGLVHFAKHALRKKHLRVVGLCTDSPSNITGTGRSYTIYILSHTNAYSGYIALTTGLDELFNVNKKPSLILEGIVETNSIEKKENFGKYFFFGGALLARYGVYDLIKAFKLFSKTNKGYKLVISGHHADQKGLDDAINNDKNIKYLGAITVDECYALEKGAIANINPRPFSEDLDRYSIPSKTLEYLESGVPTISVKNSKLQKVIGDLIIWSKSSSDVDLAKSLEHVISLTKEERMILGDKAKDKVHELYSLDAVNKKINDFLKKLD